MKNNLIAKASVISAMMDGDGTLREKKKAARQENRMIRKEERAERKEEKAEMKAGLKYEPRVTRRQVRKWSKK